MTAWMTGMNHRSDRHSYGDVVKVMIRPIPRVAAEMTSGRENSARGAELLVTNKARGTQMHAAAVANISEVKITDCVETDSAGNAPEKKERHAESETWPFTTTDL